MKFALAVASLAATATAAVVGKVNPQLDVSLERESNSGVKISLTNNGDKELHLLNKGTILDESPVQKVHVYKGAQKQTFKGLKKHVYTQGDVSKVLTPLKKGDTIDLHLDAAQVHDLTQGGRFSLLAKGSIPFSEAGANKISGLAQYESKKLDIDVDGIEAASVAGVFSHEKRTQLQTDCTGDFGAATATAIGNCVSLANTAADFALNGDSGKFSEYFMSDDTDTRNTVNARLTAVANECSSNSTGATQYYCNEADVGACDDNVLAYTYPTENVVVNCNLYYSALPAITDECHAQDQATTTLHEFTHANGVYSPGTDDNAYGYDACMQLDTAGAVGNADTYALFANALYSGC